MSAVLVCVALVGVWDCFAAARAADLKLEVKLIWGTNDATSPNPKHKKLDSALTQWLAKKFKWTSYFEENQQVVSIPLNSTKSVSLSDVCKLEIKHLGGTRIAVKLYGHGKLVNTVTHTLPQNDRLVIAGDDKNDSAWFIVFKLLPADGK